MFRYDHYYSQVHYSHYNKRELFSMRHAASAAASLGDRDKMHGEDFYSRDPASLHGYLHNY